ncbi:MAG: ABC transporter ATP-binding protein [Candidatus Tectomicrobia bacterium]|uniref:ABC transporter ATP-binding protein n=1 Tax=Tectimicrobiota bacterium TaxID=2528274 RepID=A0A932I0M5_UNCTE|nr:ABC transporter ATP-binding protein [Candidatus Tectomicrobia bacterium]
MARLVLTGLRKSYGDVRAVDGVSLSVPEREFLVVVGPTGCGKSTLLRLIAGVDRPDAGHIVLDGQRMNDVPLGKRGIQMIFQGYALWPHMRVFDEKRYSNLGFALKVRRWVPDSIARRVRDVMRRVGIEEELARRRPAELSSGQQQKVAIGRAIALPPRVFLLDEPMANIDPVSRRQVRAELRRVHDELGTVTLLVTHDLADAFHLADRIAIMRDGRFLQVDAPRRLFEAPADPFVSDFLSSFAPLWWERAKGAGG